MAESGNIKILKDSLLKAKKYHEEKNYGRAFAHYLVVFQLLQPEARKAYQKEFIDVLYLWGSILHGREKYEDVFRCYHLALTYFPVCEDILNNLGVHALKLKNFKTAKTYFENALSNDYNFLPAEQNLQTTKYALVDRWHFPMLNDLHRNKAYAQAIFTAISQGFTSILDVGTGTGLLSLFASKSKQCRSIIACDYSETMCDIARKVIQANNAQNIQLINKVSTSMSVPNDFKKRASLLVTEILDSGIFGENILETVIHAWDQLLISAPYGKVIPVGVAIYVCGIQSSSLSAKTRVQDNKLLKLDEICLTYSTAPYDTENLKIANFTYITESELALYVNFNNVHQLKLLNNSKDNTIITLKCLQSGRIDAFAVWFVLYLNENITLTNNPKSDVKSCWDQAIHYVHHPITVQNEQVFNVKLSCCEGYLEIETTFDNNLNEINCCFVPRSTVLFLNDTVLMNCLLDLSKRITEHYKNENDTISITVLDVSPFPILGLLLAEKGAQLTCRLSEPNLEKPIRLICEKNAINESNINIVHCNDFSYTNENIKYDIVFHNLLNTCGLLFEEEMLQSELMQFAVRDGGYYFPKQVNIWAQLVECDWLNFATKVDDKNICGLKIAEFINEYKSTEQRDINFNSISHKILSNPQNLGLLTNDVMNPHLLKTKIPITCQGTANAVFYWFELELMEGQRVNTRRSHSFVNNAAFMFNVPLLVNVGNEISLILKQHKSILKIYVDETMYL